MKGAINLAFLPIIRNFAPAKTCLNCHGTTLEPQLL